MTTCHATRDSTKRSSFICVNCKKTFTDLEAEQLWDHVSNEFQCSYCGEIVEEGPDVLPKADSRLMLTKFNDQMEPYGLMEVEDIKIPADLLEPDPIEVNGSTIKLVKGSKHKDRKGWRSSLGSGQEGATSMVSRSQFIHQGPMLQK
uniref:Uncharacterized protein n=1 Tax=Tetranychus urticae TaxID=32264 RepID=T1JQE5_TETUR